MEDIDIKILGSQGTWLLTYASERELEGVQKENPRCDLLFKHHKALDCGVRSRPQSHADADGKTVTTKVKVNMKHSNYRHDFDPETDVVPVN